MKNQLYNSESALGDLGTFLCNSDELSQINKIRVVTKTSHLTFSHEFTKKI